MYIEKTKETFHLTSIVSMLFFLSCIILRWIKNWKIEVAIKEALPS